MAPVISVNGDKIYVMNVDGTNPTDILNDSTATSSDLTPAWSSDGTQITFAANRAALPTPGSGPHDTWVMDADGSNLDQITFGGQFGISPAWSPDGTKIAYGRTTTPNQIYVINADGSGSGQTQLTSSAGGNFSASWSPNGTEIIFSSRRDGNDQIYVMGRTSRALCLYPCCW